MGLRCLGWLVFVAALSVGSWCEVAQAQDASDSDEATARRLFGEGLAALEDERWEEAREAFTGSYELIPRSNTLLNLATAQAELNLPVEAIRTYRAFIEQATRRQRRHVRDAEQAITELEVRVAHVELTIRELERADIIRLDDEELPQRVLLEPLAMNPGHHVLVVLRDEVSIGRVELVLVEGETRGLEVALHPPDPVVETPLIVEPPGEGPDGLAIGLGVGAGVVAIALGVVLALVFTQEGEAPYMGNLGLGTVTF